MAKYLSNRQKNLKIGIVSYTESNTVLEVTGKVGIGTTNAGALLNVVPSSTSIAGLFSGTSSSDMVRITQLGTGNALVVEDSTNPDATPFVVTAAGDVGIGTTNTGSYALHINTKAISSGLRITQQTNDPEGGAENILAIFGNKSFWSTNDSASIQVGFGRIANTYTGDGTNWDLRFLTGSSASPTEKLRITGGGAVLVGSATSTGTSSQRLQVTGGAYISTSVGIGTTNPTKLLHVYGANNTSPLLINVGPSALYEFSGNSTSTYTATFNITDTGLSIGHSSAIRDLRLQTNSLPRITILGGGNVGINTTNPTQTLDVRGNVAVSGVTTTQHLQVTGVTTAVNISATGISTLASLNVTGVTTTQHLQVTGITTFTNGPVLIGTGTSTGTSSQRLQVTGGAYVSGNVGVGTTNPTETGISVLGKVLIHQDSGSNNRLIFRGQPGSSYRWNIDNYSSTNEFRIFREDDSTSANGFAPFSISTTGTVTATKFSGDGSLLTNLPTGGGGGSSQWVTTSAGIHTLSNVGIGTTNPTSKLTVSGDAIIVGVITANSFRARGGDPGGLGANNNGYGFQGIGDNDSGMYSSADGQIEFYSNSAEAARITSNRNLLIGSTSETGISSQKLQVTGGAYISNNLGVGVSNPTSKLSVVGDGNFTGVVTALSFSGNASSATYAASAGVSTNLKGGLVGNIPYQSAADTTVFLANGTSGFILQSNGVGNAPSWVAAAPSNAISGLTVRDEGSIVGSANSISQFDFKGINVTATASGSISTITVADNLVGTALSISGISTFSNGPILVGSATSTGTASQPLQVTGGAYVSGSLGIGITNPTSKLTVGGDGNFTGVVTAITFSGQVNAGISTISVNSSSNALRINQLGSGNALVVEDETNPDATPFVVTAAGNLGVGVTNTIGFGTAKAVISRSFGRAAGVGLWIEAGDNTGSIKDNVALILNDGSSGSSGGNSLIFRQTNVGSPRRYAGIWGVTELSGSGGNLVFGTIDSDNDTTGPIERARIDSSGNFLVGSATSTGTASQRLQVTGGGYFSGNVGVGTTNPTASLTVTGNTANILIGKQYANANAITLNGSTAAADYNILSTSSNNLVINRPSGKTIVFSQADTGHATFDSSNNLLLNSGNLAIGNFTPLYALDAGSASLNKAGRVGGIIFGTAGNSYGIVGYNAKPSAVNAWTYDVTDVASWVQFLSGGHVFYRAVSGTAGNAITPLESGRFDSSGNFLVGSATSTGTASQPLQVTGGAYVSGNTGIGTTNPTSSLHVVGDALVTGVVTATTFIGALTGTATTASSVTVNSVGLGTHTYGDYVRDITGTANQITVTSGTGEGSTPTLSIPNQFTAPQDVTVTRDLQVNRNLNVNGSITIGGTSATLFTTELKIYDPDIVLGFRTDALGNDSSTDNTANHGGIAIASTEGTPLTQLFIAGIETNPATYKKIMWFKSGTFTGLGTDAWLSNYAIGIGSTQVPNGVRLAAGGMQVTDTTLSVPRLNISGISTFTGNVSFGSSALFGDNDKIILGDGSDLQIYHDSATNRSYIQEFGTGALYIQGSDLYLTDDDGTNMLYAANNAGVSLYHSGTERLRTVGYGATVFGVLETQGLLSSGISTISVNSSSDALRITQTGAGNALVVEDSTNPDSTPFVVTAAGDVGIGTTNPQTKLDIQGGEVYYHSGSSNNLGIKLTYSNGNSTGIIDTYGNHALEIRTNNTERVRITSGGNVGINTTTPGALLNVVPTSTSVAGLFSGTTSDDMVRITQLGTGNALVVEDSSNPDTTPFVVTGSGSVGIGTTNPTNAALHIRGGASYGGALRLTNTGTSGGDYFILSSDSTWDAGADKLLIGRGSPSSSNVKIVLDSSGNLGVNTTNPTSKLSVVGDGIFTGIVTATTFNGNLTGNVTGNLNSSGVNTATTLSGTTVTYTTGNFTTANIVTGIVTTVSGTNLNYTGVGTVTTLNSTNSTLTNINSSGISTLGVTSATNLTAQQLNVSGIATISSNLIVDTNTFYVDATNNRVGVLTASPIQPFQVGTAGTNVVVVDAIGEIGIGTTSPLQKLHVLGNLLVAAGSSTGQHITQKAYELNSGTLSWEGSAGQLFSITNNLTSGSIFSVNDVSGIPSIDVDANGTVEIAPFGGNLGVGTTNPTSKLDVIGDVRVSGVITCTDLNSTSDISLKKNIQTFDNALEVVNNLRGVKFEWNENSKPSIGVIAQELEQVLPELVNGSDPKTVNYNGLIGVLIEAIKEQQKEIEAQQKEIDILKKHILP